MNNNKFFLNCVRYGIVLFWVSWLLLVFLTDLIDLLQQINLIPIKFPFSSGNYNLIVNSQLIYDIHCSNLFLCLFLMVIACIFVQTVLFATTLFFIDSILPYFAFLLGFFTTAIFILYDEIFIQYSYEHGHMIRLTFQMTTFFLFNYAQENYKKYYLDRNI